MGEKAEGSEPIVERDDDCALLRERRGVVTFFAAESGPESAAVDPDEHGTRGAGSGKRECIRPDVEVETILGNSRGERIDVAVRLVLDAVVAELTCGAHIIPVPRGLRRFPAQLADRRGGVGDAAKHHHAGGVEALEGAGVDRHAWRGGDARCANGGEDGGTDQKRSIRHAQRCSRTMRTATYDYRPRAVGWSAVGFGLADLCERFGAGGVPSLTRRHFRRAYNILRTRIVWVTSERKSFSEMALVSRASMRWYSNSELEFSAYFGNRANSFSLSCRLPSAMFAGIDVAARKS